MSADDERIPPLTVGQLGLCGPLSDDTSVGPDAARHTPPADGPDGDLAEAERLCRTRTLPGDARGALDLLLAEYDRRAEEIEALREQRSAVMAALNTEGCDPVGAASFTRQAADALAARLEHAEHVRDVAVKMVGDRDAVVAALQARVAAVRVLADKAERDRMVLYGGIERASGQVPSADLLAALDGLPGPLSPAPKDSQTPDGPAEEAGLCPECGSEPDPTPLVARPDMVECQHHCGAWVRPDADPAVTSALDWWHRRVREEEARRLASDTAAHRVLTEWPRMHPCGYLAMYPAMDALRAAVAAPRVEPAPTPAALALVDDLLRPWAYGYPVNPGYAGRAAQYVSVETLAGWNARRAALASATAPRVEPAPIGTWADPEFRAHQDHKHAVDGCGFCPSEEDR